MSITSTVRFIWRHPLASRQRRRALGRYFRWQVGSRIGLGPVAVDFVNDARLLVRPGMTGATGNVYVGLHEFEDMAFTLHLLRPADRFADVGANVGSYTVLAAKCVGAHVLACEPVPAAFSVLRDNVLLNGVAERVDLRQVAVGDTTGIVRMTPGFDTGNRIATAEDGAAATTSVPIAPLDDLLGDRSCQLIKIDVEGFEPSVIAGARNILKRSDLLGVLMETNDSSLAHGVDPLAAHRDLLTLGFRSYGYEPFTRQLIDLNGATRPHSNTLYVRDPSAVALRLRSAQTFRVIGEDV